MGLGVLRQDHAEIDRSILCDPDWLMGVYSSVKDNHVRRLEYMVSICYTKLSSFTYMSWNRDELISLSYLEFAVLHLVLQLC